MSIIVHLQWSFKVNSDQNDESNIFCTNRVSYFFNLMFVKKESNIFLLLTRWQRVSCSEDMFLLSPRIWSLCSPLSPEPQTEFEYYVYGMGNSYKSNTSQNGLYNWFGGCLFFFKSMCFTHFLFFCIQIIFQTGYTVMCIFPQRSRRMDPKLNVQRTELISCGIVLVTYWMN